MSASTSLPETKTVKKTLERNATDQVRKRPLRSSTRTERCALCGRTLHGTGRLVKDRLHHTPGLYLLKDCQACGHTQTCGADFSEVAQDAYPERYLTRALGASGSSFPQRVMNHFYEKMEKKRVDRILSMIDLPTDGTALDAGCGNGGFLRELQRRTGCSCTGVETDAASIQVARKNSDLNLVCGTLEEYLAGCSNDRFSLITLWHVLEHLSDPLEALSRLYTATRPGGWLVLAVPDVSGLTARVFGNYWFGCDVPRHLHHFTAPTLTSALIRTGWRPMQASHVVEVSTLAGSLHNLFGRRWCDDLSSHFGKWAALQTLGLSFDHLFRILGFGDWLEIAARKPAES